MFNHILIPTDGSPISNKAAKAGVALASRLKARVTVYFAIEELQMIYAEGYAMDQITIDRIEEYGRERGQKHIDAVSKVAKRARVPFQMAITKALTPSGGIVAAAKKYKCDAIFMASHGRGGLSRLIMGSVTNKVLSHSKVPVVVYR